MSYSPASPATGGPQSGLTSPTYTLSADTPPDVNAIAKVVTALGGTQTGVVVSSPSIPFQLVMSRPKVLRTLPVGANGLPSSIPRNVWTLLTRKGVTVLVGLTQAPMLIRTEISVPAGADSADPLSVKAALSLHAGVLWEQSSGIGVSLVTGAL